MLKLFIKIKVSNFTEPFSSFTGTSGSFLAKFCGVRNPHVKRLRYIQLLFNNLYIIQKLWECKDIEQIMKNINNFNLHLLCVLIEQIYDSKLFCLILEHKVEDFITKICLYKFILHSKNLFCFILWFHKLLQNHNLLAYVYLFYPSNPQINIFIPMGLILEMGPYIRAIRACISTK